MDRFKTLTILHSNDLHGDFLSKELDAELLGGISMLSGYVSKVRQEAPNTLYCIAGDMLQGSVIDSEFRGISTIEIMNLLRPDVASIGNHEIDYGLAHLLFLERCAAFPIVNANLFIKNPYTRLFSPHVILEVDGMKIMFIGIVTEDVMLGMRKDVLGSFVDVEDAAKEVGHICNAFRQEDIDFTVLLTHIGFEEDKKLAARLDPEWGVDLIIGGHTHTILEKPETVADILIVQAGVGTKQIGRFDIVLDTGKNTIHSYDWQLIPIESGHCPRNEQMERMILQFKAQTDKKYNRPLCQFTRPLTHPDRYRETELGNLFADLLQSSMEVDIALLGSGSIRKEAVDTILTYGGLMELLPFDDSLMRLRASGAQFKRMVAYTLREEMLLGGHTEFYQYSQGLSMVFDRESRAFTRFDFQGAPMEEARLFTLALQGYHYINFTDCFGFSLDELLENGRARVLSTSVLDVLVEHLPEVGLRDARVEGRLVVE